MENPQLPSPATELVQSLLALADPSYRVLPSPSNPPSTSTTAPVATPAVLPPAKTALNKLLSYTNHIIPARPRDAQSASIDDADARDRILMSWKMSDFAYQREPCPFPTRARGLFTERIVKSGSTSQDAEEYRIIARGYDKFFNINEVSWTKWDNLAKLTTAPYELTHKSNGCIILICALSPTQTLVTSKHSLGKVARTESQGGGELLSHSEHGEYWLRKHLEAAGKTEAELATVLWQRNLTAVAELCDDSFEEHVLPYPPHLTGLHLHGLNQNTPLLLTLPSVKVAEFAKNWGLIPTPFQIFPSLDAVRSYCEQADTAGGIPDDENEGAIVPVEGFVVRGVKRKGMDLLGQPTSTTVDAAEVEPFFWKVKFDEPYLMYREWRELTRKILAKYPGPSQINANKIKNPLSRLYVFWVEREIYERNEKFANWAKGRDIIKIREEFLVWKESSEGRAKSLELGLQVLEVDGEERIWERTLIVPVAIPGSGKTSLGLALSHLFGWGHTQSDDIPFKKAGPHFIRNVKELLATQSVVFADKNNHIAKLRSDLIAASKSLKPPKAVRTLAFVWDISTTPSDTVHSFCEARIESRGANHQNLRSTDPDYVDTVRKFFGQFEEFDEVCNEADSAFQHVFRIDFAWDLERVVKESIRFLESVGVISAEEVPSDESILDAVRRAGEYKVEEEVKEASEVTKEKAKKKEKFKPRYYGIAITGIDLKAELDRYFADEGRGKELWEKLKEGELVERNPHITLVHEMEVKMASTPELSIGVDSAPTLDSDPNSAPNLWNRYASLVAAAAIKSSDPDVEAAPLKTDAEDSSTLVEVTLGPMLVFDSRVMSIEVSSIVSLVSTSPSTPNEAASIDTVGAKPAHVTVGTLGMEIRPIEGKFIVERALAGERTTELGGVIGKIDVGLIKCRGRIAGLK